MMRLLPQRRFSFFILRMRFLIQVGVGGLPGFLFEGKVQNDLRRLRYQERMVSGLMMVKEE